MVFPVFQAQMDSHTKGVCQIACQICHNRHITSRGKSHLDPSSPGPDLRLPFPGTCDTIRVKEVFDQEGIEIPYPKRDIIIRKELVPS